MPSLPRVYGADAVRELERLGFVVAGQRGSHIVMRRRSTGCVVPNHRELKVGTLAGILKQAGVTPDEFIGSLQLNLTLRSTRTRLGGPSAASRAPVT